MAVLIVCGDTSATDTLAGSLVEDGHEVVTAGTGRRALDMLKFNRKITAVIVDRDIPDMSPFDLFQAYNAYREMQWPGCDTSRESPAFILSHPLRSQADAGDPLPGGAVTNNFKMVKHFDSRQRRPVQTAYEPSPAMR